MPPRTTPNDYQQAVRREVGARVLSLRRQAGLSQEDLGEHAGMDRRTIGRIENGTVAGTLDQLSAIARAIGVPPWRLLRDE
ncbi:helix-turn-helix domain-containing protein [Kitasatospora aureofaciens]|uniref:helix-turn-helix domain-containing protein n=1 Tax=Kitasatospora aureofaciens TaxID=1894 RepID=UPI001C47224C|nr:helix-turn-helix transcriptional regulator [Kitasatospora aureofaciens]MBV6697417.1 helix-turn-helix domain-containing protein [Kitasatospora aureofaciens]